MGQRGRSGDEAKDERDPVHAIRRHEHVEVKRRERIEQGAGIECARGGAALPKQDGERGH